MRWLSPILFRNLLRNMALIRSLVRPCVWYRDSPNVRGRFQLESKLKLPLFSVYVTVLV